MIERLDLTAEPPFAFADLSVLPPRSIKIVKYLPTYPPTYLSTYLPTYLTLDGEPTALFDSSDAATAVTASIIFSPVAAATAFDHTLLVRFLNYT